MAQDYRTTISIAEAALGKIGALRQPADPKSFALWFKYAADHSGLLSAAVNTCLTRKGSLATGDIEEIYHAHIAPKRPAGKSDGIGTRMACGIQKIRATVERTERVAGHYSRDIASAATRLSGANNREGVRAIVEGLLQATRTLAADNERLRDQLRAVSQEMAQLRREIAEVRAESQTDPLTGLGNRRFFSTAIEKAVANCHAAKKPLALLLADVDGIKSINENYGTIVGDRVLRFIAMVIRESIAEHDVAARYNGDAFVVILPKTALLPAVRVAEQLRHAVMKCELVRRTTGEKARLTLSVGVVSQNAGSSAQALIEAAQMCLHAAKRAGRNCVISEADDKLFAAVAGSAAKA